MLTHRERILKVAKGELVDRIPWVPRIDLWHNAHQLAGTLPEKYEGLSVEDIHRLEGWPLHKMVPEYLRPEKPEDIIHRAIGLYRLKEYPFDFEFSSDVDIRVAYEEDGDEQMTHVAYYTPAGMISVRHGTTDEMRKSGASITWVKEAAIKGPEDYAKLAYIFGNLTLKPAYDRFIRWKESVGEDGVAVAHGLGIGCSSPLHFIQKTFLGATDFYYHYNDYQKEIGELVEALEHVFDELIRILAESPADVVLWSSNTDDMITYRSYFKEDILPWCQKVSEALRAKGILTAMHPDGENKGLMDLVPECGIDIADAVTPYPMTKVKIGEYYDTWCRSGNMTIHGGIPEIMLLEESTSLEELETYLDDMFSVISPGKRFIASIGDTSPPNTDFDRLIYIGERIEKEGRLPLEAGSARPLSSDDIQKATERVAKTPVEGDYQIIQEDVLKGDHKKIIDDVGRMLKDGCEAKDILNVGMLPAMEVIGDKFKAGTVYIPEVLLAARAMNEALSVLEPHLVASDQVSGASIMIGTVRGDLHDIGKNMVITMLKGVGFDTVDLGVNVKSEDFVDAVREKKPDVLGISALLTTTMPQMRKVVDDIVAAGLRNNVKIIVGGAPVNQKFCDDIGADGYALDAGDAVTVVKNLLK
jgi:methanogenic corrinoid protein MtbC1